MKRHRLPCRWVKFWFNDEKNTLDADADAFVFPGSMGKKCEGLRGMLAALMAMLGQQGQ